MLDRKQIRLISTNAKQKRRENLNMNNYLHN